MPDDSSTGRADSEIPENHLNGAKLIAGASHCVGAAAQKASASGMAGSIPQTAGRESRGLGLSDETMTALLENIDRHCIGSTVVRPVSESWEQFHYQQTARGAKQIPSYEQFRRAIKLRVQQQQTIKRGVLNARDFRGYSQMCRG